MANLLPRLYRRLLAVFAVMTIFSSAAHAQMADFILVEKAKRLMTLYAGGKPVKTYTIALGGAPVGHKTTQGDNRTPEGKYRIDFKNNKSQFYLSLRISYPNAADKAQARKRGVSAGGDIFIHGQPRLSTRKSKIPYDWTLGCIAVSNAEIEEIWQKVAIGTIIEIKP
jgi:murein L,D-transpeptidase YafK